MFETEFNPQNSFSAGLSFNYDAYDQHYRLENTTDNPLKTFEKEAVPGAYVQYTLNLNDKWMCWRKTTTCFPAVARWK